MSTARVGTFEEFWPVYLAEHRHPLTRRLHFIGSSAAIGFLLGAVLTQSWALLIAVPLSGYGFAWTSHTWVERNRPLTFKYPLWSLAADYRMWWRMLTGRLELPTERAR